MTWCSIERVILNGIAPHFDRFRAESPLILVFVVDLLRLFFVNFCVCDKKRDENTLLFQKQAIFFSKTRKTSAFFKKIIIIIIFSVQ
jgi:hypothetical protein